MTRAQAANRRKRLAVAGVWLSALAIAAIALIEIFIPLPSVLIIIPGLVAAISATWAIRASSERTAHAMREQAADIERKLWDALPRIAGEPPPVADRSADQAFTALRALGQQVQRQLARLEADRLNLAAMLEGVDEPVLVTGVRGEILLCNRAGQEFLSAKPERLKGRRLEDLVTYSELLELAAAARAGVTRRAEMRLTRPEGKRIYLVTASPIVLAEAEILAQPLDAAPPPHASAASDDPDPRGVVITLRDITELATAVQVKTDFVANASHELRTPIAAIRAAAETLASDEPATPPPPGTEAAMRVRLLGMIGHHALRLEELVRDLMDLSRLESPDAPMDPAPVRLTELADQLATTFDQACRERNLGLAFSIDPAVDLIHSDRRLVQLILKNLIDNASKFAYEGTSIRVVATPLPLDSADDSAEPSDRRPAAGEIGGVRLSVTDRGIGIPFNQQHRVFERFYQVDAARTSMSERRGTGLGLAIVKHAVKGLGGVIRLNSVWKEGTTITVDLPGCIFPDDSADGRENSHSSRRAG